MKSKQTTGKRQEKYRPTQAKLGQVELTRPKELQTESNERQIMAANV